MLFLSGRGAVGAGPSGWTRIAPWMRTTGDTGKVRRKKSEGVSEPLHLNLHWSIKGPGTSGALSSLTGPSPASSPAGCWTRGCRRTVALGGPALGGTGTVVSTTGLGCSGGFRVAGAFPEGREREVRNYNSVRPLTREPRGLEAPLPEELSGDGPMLIWTAPSEEAGTSHRRHPGGDGDSVFTSRTSSPVRPCAGQSSDISWECWYGAGGQAKASHAPGEGCWAARERGREVCHLAGRVC